MTAEFMVVGPVRSIVPLGYWLGDRLLARRLAIARFVHAIVPHTSEMRRTPAKCAAHDPDPLPGG
jgi:hypothetical protein